MRPRTPTFLWIPFVFSLGTISWAILLAGLGVMAAVVLAPAIQDYHDAEGVRNNYQATLDLLDQKIAMQKTFVAAAATEPVLMERLASRQLHLEKSGEEVLRFDPETDRREAAKDHSVETLLAESLTPVQPKPAAPMPWLLAETMNKGVRGFLVTVSCLALVLSFMLGVRYERS